ncbi:MAG: hypothetical protein HY396_01050 [Candidatus Doudnabacteria bacterium]|nr:hypothetical protein [Candidatus Doudnabacteria bacterium]
MLIPKQGVGALTLEERIQQFRRDVGQGLTPEQKIPQAEELLHDLRADYKGLRTISAQRSRDHRKYIKFVLARAREAQNIRSSRR